MSEPEVSVIAESCTLAGTLGWTGIARQAVPFQCTIREREFVASPSSPGPVIVQMSLVDGALTSPSTPSPGSRKTCQLRPLNLAANGWQFDEAALSERARQPKTQTSSGPKTLTD